MNTARRNFAADINPGTGEVFAVGGYAPTTASASTEKWSALIFNFTSISGTAPHRIFNIEYRTRYYNSGGDGVPLNYEVRLFEGQVGYEVIYGTINVFDPPSTRSLSVGMQLDFSPTHYSLYGCDPTGGTAPPVPPAGHSLVWGACGTP